MDIIEAIVQRAFLNFLMLGSVAGLIVGVILILRPHWLASAGMIVNRWIPSRHLDRALERVIVIDPVFYRYRRTSSLVTMAGAIYVLYFFSVGIDKASAVSGLAKNFQMPAAYIGALYDPMQMIAILGAMFAMFACLFVLFQPNQFQKFEQGANQWVSLRKSMKPLEILRNNVDEFTFLHTRQVGFLLVLGSIYTLVVFAMSAS
jgi:hypothetical protein